MEGVIAVGSVLSLEPLVEFLIDLSLAEAAHRCFTMLFLANIAIRVRRKYRSDPVKEQIIGDAEANRFVDLSTRTLVYVKGQNAMTNGKLPTQRMLSSYVIRIPSY